MKTPKRAFKLKDYVGDEATVSGERFVELRLFAGRDGYAFHQYTPAQAKRLAKALIERAEHVVAKGKVRK